MAGAALSGQGVPTAAFFERHAWRVFTGLSLIVVLFGIGDIPMGGSTFQSGEAVLFRSLSGTTWEELAAAEPGAAHLIDYQVRAGGAHLLVAGLLSLAIAITALRRGERWAWIAMWTWPLWTGLVVALLLFSTQSPGAGIPVPVISGTAIFIVSVATLALSLRRYLSAR